MNQERIREITTRIRDVKVAVYGDFCLDAYWVLDPRGSEVSLETGLQAANGIATLALTYTLLGISLGIGSLAGHELGPETIQAVIRDLTRHFSMASGPNSWPARLPIPRLMPRRV